MLHNSTNVWIWCKFGFYSEYDESLADGDNVSSDSGLKSSAIFSLDLTWASFLGLFLIKEEKPKQSV